MKRILFVGIFLLTVNSSFCQSLSIEQKLSSLSHVWGLVKYYQPNAAKKKIDWDTTFVNNYMNIKNSIDFTAYNLQLKNLLLKTKLSSRKFTDKDSLKIKWITNGELSKLDNFKILNDTLNYIHCPDFSWIKNDSVFTQENQNLLFQIIIDFKPVKIKYLKGSNVISHDENPFSKIDSVSEPYRILGLFRYWNIINYFYPYKNLIDKKWDSVLIENIPKFIKSDSYGKYFQQIKHLASEINDTHAWETKIDPKYGLKQKASNNPNHQTYSYPPIHPPLYPPFKFEMIDTNLIISQILNDSLAKSGTIQKGDMLLQSNNTKIFNAINKLRYYTPYSTEQSFMNTAKYFLIYYLADSTLFNFTIVRGKDTFIVNNIKGINYQMISKMDNDTIPPFYSIKNKIGYINLDKVSAHEIRKAYRKYKNLSAIIFDMRGYPSGIAPIFLPRVFSRKPIPVANYFYPSKEYAGIFIKNKSPENYFIENTASLYFKFLFNIDSKIFPTFNKIYKGKVIVLINDEAISYAETVCMILKAYAKDITFIGTPTQGANGDVVDFFMPGGIKVSFSSLDWHSPNHDRLQRVGIIPDILVNRTIESIKNGNDEILDRAIEYIETGK